MRRWSLIALAVVLSLAMALPATLNVVGQTPTPAAQNQAWVRIVNTSPDSPPITVQNNDGSTLFCNVPFGAVTRYATVGSGSFNFRVLPVTAVSPAAGTPTAAATAGATAAATAARTPTRAVTPTRALTPTQALSPTTALTPTRALSPTTALTPTAVSPVSGTPTAAVGATAVPSTPQPLVGAQGIPISGTLQPGQAYSMVVVGRQADTQTLILTDDLSAPPAGKAKVRFVHASPDAQAMKVAAGGRQLFDNVAFKTATGYMDVDPGTVNVTVTPAGATSQAVTVPSVTLTAGTVYTVYAEGLAAGSPALQAKVTVESVGGMPVPATP